MNPGFTLHSPFCAQASHSSYASRESLNDAPAHAHTRTTGAAGLRPIVAGRAPSPLSSPFTLQRVEAL
eukprot:scaffold49459_cov36-Tisochrysis_lutea.AAC.1